MKGKVLRVFLAIIIALPMFTSVLAVSSDDLLARLESIAGDIEHIKDEYEDALDTYSGVVDSLSDESKETIEDLRDGLILEDGMTERVDALKAELKTSSVDGADELLSSTQGVQDAFNDMLDDNKDIIEEVKTGYSDLTIEEINQVIEKVVEIAESLGLESDTTETYDDMMLILEQAHGMALDINIRLEAIMENYVATFEDALTIKLVKEVFAEIQNKDRAAVVDTLIEALDNADGGAELKANLKDVKAIAVDLKDKLMELDGLSEEDLLMFTDEQKTDVSNKVKAIEKDYIDFAKTILDSCAQDYMEIVINLAYEETVDQMIDYANAALDYYKEYKDTIASLTGNDIIDRLGLPEELIEKAGLMVALGFVDTTNYNKEYIKENFKTQIDDTTKYLAKEFVDYLDHIDSTIADEVMSKYMNGKDAAKTQSDLRTITASRFATLTNLKALKARVDTELLANKDDLKSDVNELADYVYNMYNENILTSIIATIMKENEQQDKAYEVDGEQSLIITNKFMSSSDFTAELGVPRGYESVVAYKGLENNTLKTGSVYTIQLSEYNVMQGTFAVLGDVFADGVINSRDYMVIKNWVMHGKDMTPITLIAADTFRDKVVNSRDYMAIKNYVMHDQEIVL